MRHGAKIKKLGRPAAHRRAMLGNLATSVIMHRSVTTTAVRARAVCRVVEHLVTLAKRGDLHARRLAAATIHDKAALHMLFAEIGPQLAARTGGYTRALRVGIRQGDGAALSVVQLLVERPQPAKEKTKEKKKKSKTESSTETAKKEKTAKESA